MSKIRWGLLSTANINRRVIPAIRESERGKLTAVASRSEASAAAYAAQWDIPQAFGSYEALLASDAVDAVYISLPNHLHAEWSIKAMQQGKHVLCEKPFTLTVAETDAVTAVAAETGMVVTEAFMYRHHPQTKIVGEWVRSGRLGEISLVHAFFSFKLDDLTNVRMIPELGGGSLWDVGCYPMSLAQYVMGGPPEWVIGKQNAGASGVDVDFAGQLHYPGGGVAQIASSFRTPFHTFAEIIGTEGRLVLKRPFVWYEELSDRITFYPAEGEPQLISVPEEYLYLGEIEDMHSAIMDGKSHYLTHAETRNHIKTLLALYESARTGETIRL